jgi:hypothetical protein
MNTSKARQALLVALAVFALTQAALAAGLLRALSLCDPDHDRKLARLQARLRAQPRPLTVVQVGSSRTAFGLRGREVEPWLSERLGRPVVLFNMGFYGAGPMTNLVNLHRLRNQGICPDLLLLEVMPVFLNQEEPVREVNPVQMPAGRLRRDEMRLVARLAGNDRPDIEHEWWLARLAPLYFHRREVVTRIAPTFLELMQRQDHFAGIDDSGWLPAYEVPRNLAVPQTRGVFGEMLRTFHLSPRQVSALRETVDLARREGMATALVVMPEGPTFRSWYPPGAWESVEQALHQVSRECDVPLLNLRCTVPEEEFSDSHHLMASGAARFTRDLAARLEPLLRRIARPEAAP